MGIVWTDLSIYKYQKTAVYCSLLVAHPFRKLKNLSLLTLKILVPLVKAVVIPTFSAHLQGH